MSQGKVTRGLDEWGAWLTDAQAKPGDTDRPDLCELCGSKMIWDDTGEEGRPKEYCPQCDEEE